MLIYKYAQTPDSRLQIYGDFEISNAIFNLLPFLYRLVLLVVICCYLHF